jgi:hypothetical protein
MVIFNGKAMDNGRIRMITAEITNADGDTALYTGTRPDLSNPPPLYYSNPREFPIALWNATNNSLETAVPGNITGNTIANMRAANSTIPWGFETVINPRETEVSMDFGHVVNWRFAWDSSTVEGVAVNDVRITFRAYDFSGNASVITDTGDNPNRKNVNIVPYILELDTGLSNAMRSNPSTFNRSARGWYPVRENDPFTIRGFNLGTDAATTTMTINATPLTRHTGVIPEQLPAIAAGQFRVVDSREIRVNTGTAANSGAVVVTVNGVTSINNRNNADADAAHYNMEPNGVNNDRLNDDRNLYIWRVGAFHTHGVGTTRLEFPYLNPVMRMDSASNWYLAYGGAATAGAGSPTHTTWIPVTNSNTTGGALYVARNSNIPTTPYRTTNRMRHTTVAFDTFGNAYTIGADQTAGRTDWRFANTTGGTGAWTWRTQTDQSLPIAGGDRFQIPRIATQSTGGTAPSTANPVRVLLSYFDNLNNVRNDLYFHFGAVAGATSAATLNAAQIVANNASLHQGSMFSAVGFLTTGRPVIAWYDRTNMNLVLSYGSGVPATNATSLVTATGNQIITTTAAHNLTEGQPVLVNGTIETTVVTVPSTTTFSLGREFTGDITVTPGFRPTATGRTTTANSATRFYTFLAGHGFTANNEEVRINYNGEFSTAFVREVVSTNNVRFSRSSGGTVNVEFEDDTTHWEHVIVYRPGRILTGTAGASRATGTWQGNAVVVHGTGGRATGAAGSHVDMVIDTANNVHLAYFDVLNGGLYYALIPPTAGTGAEIFPNVAAATIVKVDTYLSAGTRIMLNVTGNVPYISYYHASFDETRNSIRVAWQYNPTLSEGSDINDKLTGAWEVMTVPAINTPASGQLIANGVPTSGTLRGTVGLQGWNDNNITRTMIVGYMTNINYEGAILKHNIR